MKAVGGVSILNEMQEEFLIKGSSLRTKLNFASRRLGPEARASLERHLIEALGNRPILDADWYPFATYEGLLQHLLDRFLAGDVERLQEVGQFSADAALSSVYETYARGGFAAFVDRLPMFHQRLYTVSRLVVRVKEANACVLDTVNMPRISMADVHVSCGFFVGAARLLGHPKARGSALAKDTYVRYRIEW